MIQEGHLQTFELQLETKSPVFIGNGKSYTKKEYLFDPKRNIVSFLDEQKFFTYLVQHNLVDAYEKFILGNTGDKLFPFLTEICKVPKGDIPLFVRCRIDVADALDDDHTLKEIQQLIRNPKGQVYIPGSSIKGALRTALLKASLLKNPPKNPDPQLPFDKHGSFEEDYFHTLSLKKIRDRDTGQMMVDITNPLNSIMQGIRVSDSLPIPEEKLCLTRKIDEFPDNTYNSINICRECIQPGTTINCTLTLDQSILQDRLTVAQIRSAIADASQHYQTSVLRHYPHLHNYMNSKTILLGGGVGFQSKTVTDPYYGQNALDVTSKILGNAFRKHHHERDAAEGVSPRACKQTDFQGAAYPFGVCEVTIR